VIYRAQFTSSSDSEEQSLVLDLVSGIEKRRANVCYETGSSGVLMTEEASGLPIVKQFWPLEHESRQCSG